MISDVQWPEISRILAVGYFPIRYPPIGYRRVEYLPVVDPESNGRRGRSVGKRKFTRDQQRSSFAI